MLETARRDSPQELGREREAKIKIERRRPQPTACSRNPPPRCKLQAALQRGGTPAGSSSSRVQPARSRMPGSALPLSPGRPINSSSGRRRAHTIGRRPGSRPRLRRGREARAAIQFEADIESIADGSRRCFRNAMPRSSEAEAGRRSATARTKELTERTEEKEALARAERRKQKHAPGHAARNLAAKPRSSRRKSTSSGRSAEDTAGGTGTNWRRSRTLEAAAAGAAVRRRGICKN